MLAIADYEPIRSMKLPEGWQEEPPVPNFWHGPCGRTFYPPTGPAAYLMLRCSNYPTPPWALEAWAKRVQDREPHDLSEDELLDLNWHFEWLIDPAESQQFAAHTADWNGRRIVVLQGRPFEQDLLAYSLYVPMMLAWECTMQITYAAGAALYPTYLDAVLRSLRSIEWTGRAQQQRK